MYGNESDAVLDAQESPESNEKLKRSLKTRHMNMIAIGGALGTGLFLASGASISTAGPGGALAAYAIIGVMVYFIMTSLGEMATYLPVSGSFGTYATRYVDPALGFAIGWHTVLLVHLPIVLLAGAMGVWLFYVQHTFAGAYWARKENWDAGQAAVVGSSYFDLPRVLHWFTGNIGYHHIHHLASRIPNYRLREAFESSTLLQSAPRLTLWTSLKSIRLKLWDEQSQRMVGFGYRKALA